jgi:hypothetical protein
MYQVMELLQISKGLTSQDLFALRHLGGVSSVLELGDLKEIKERFIVEIRLLKLVGVFLREQADPHLDKGMGRLKQMEALIGNLDNKDSYQRSVRRHEILAFWYRQMSRLLPLGQNDRGKERSFAPKKF